MTINTEIYEDDELCCESCGIEIDEESGKSIEMPGVGAAGEIIVCIPCARRFE